MTSITLTDKFIKSLKPKDQQYEVFDDKVRGLGLRISSGGTKSFTLLYKFNGTNCRKGLGKYGAITLAEARSAASELLIKVTKGVDPRNESNGLGSVDAANLFPVVANDFIENYAKRMTKSWSETLRILNNEFSRAWPKRSIKEVSKPDIHRLLNGIQNRSGPSAANHAFAVIRKFFNWCVEQGYLPISPCAGMKKPAKASSRERVLSNEELTRIAAGCIAMSYPFGHFVMLLAATAQRRTEVSSMTWDDIDLQRRIWVQNNNKTSTPQDVPLNEPAISILSQLPRTHEHLIFPAKGKNNSITGFSKWKKQLDGICGVSDWTLHDLRRTVATGMARLKVPLHTIELVLNHSSRQLSGIAGVYNRYQYSDEKRDAMDKWGQHLNLILEQSALLDNIPTAHPTALAINPLP